MANSGNGVQTRIMAKSGNGVQTIIMANSSTHNGVQTKIMVSSLGNGVLSRMMELVQEMWNSARYWIQVQIMGFGLG
jgi:hypothetical protein